MSKTDTPALGPQRSVDDHPTARAIDEFIDALPLTPALWRWVILLAIGGFFEIYELALAGPLSNALVADGIFRTGAAGLFGLPDQASFIFATFAGMFVGTMLFAYAGDRVGRKPVFIFALIWYAVATLIMAFQNDPLSICFWRMVSGIAMGAEALAINCYLAEITPARHRGRMFAVALAIQYLAIPFGALMSAVLVNSDPLGWDGWRWLNVVPVVGAIVFWGIRRNLPESPRWLASQGRASEAWDILKSRFAAPEPGLVVAAPTVTSTIRLVADRRYLVGAFAMIIVFFNIQNVVFYGFNHWLPNFIQEKGLDIENSLFYTGAVFLAAPLAPLLYSVVTDRIERKHTIIALGVAIVGLGLMFSYSTSTWSWVSCGVMLALANYLITANSHTYMSEIFPTRMRARAVGIIYGSTRVTAAFNGYFIAALIATGGSNLVFLTIGGLMLFALTFVALLGPPTRNVQVVSSH